ncbi:MAG: hypothetical protein INR65_05065 [Gluconacetobacter diazotrophicus]|nr:hypothetical protein [Gluconacetobacter diazotrophicus]
MATGPQVRQPHPWEHPEIASAHRGSYIAGYVLSVVLMGVSLLLVVNHVMPAVWLLLVIAAIAAVTLLAQLRLLFHLDLSEHQLWNTLTLALNVPLLILSIGLTAWMFRTLYIQVMTPDGAEISHKAGSFASHDQPYTMPTMGSMQ